MGTRYETDVIARADALTRAIDETGLDLFPQDGPWTPEQALSPGVMV